MEIENSMEIMRDVGQRVYESMSGTSREKKLLTALGTQS